MKKNWIVAALLAALVLIMIAFALVGPPSQTGVPASGSWIPSPDSGTGSVLPEPPASTGSKLPGYELQSFAEWLVVPWSMVFTSPERILVTERGGTVREVIHEKLSPTPVHRFADVTSREESGLMSLALDPDYGENRRVYFCYTRATAGGGLVNKIVRVRDDGHFFSEMETVFDGMQSAQYHAGCRIRFGPDGKLYVSVGDAVQSARAQDWNAIAGKILRLNADGSIPSDNPVSDSPVYSLGHRNPQGFDWQPVTNDLYETEHGPSTFDGPPGGDEVNRIVRAGNYGWPTVSHEKSAEWFISPIFVFTPANAPASGMFYRGAKFPELTGDFLFGALKWPGIYRVDFSASDPKKIEKYELLDLPNVGRVREVAEGPDGSIYFTTSNRDGRGAPKEGDDRIYKIVRKE